MYLNSYGYSTEEMLGKHFIMFIDEDLKGSVEDILSRRMNGLSEQHEFEFIHKDGRSIQTLIETAQLYNEEGTYSGAITSVMDISKLKQVEKKLQDSRRFLRATLDGLSTNIAILAEKGEILYINKSWTIFAQNNDAIMKTVNIGVNYLEVCDQATGDGSKEATLFAAGIRAVLSGEKSIYTHEYPCHSQEEQRWFIGHVTRFPDDGPPRAVVSHENITERKLAAEEILKQAEELKNQALSLKEVNTALTVLLDRREGEKKALEENLLANSQKLILPCIDKIKSITETGLIRTYIEIIESNIKDLLSPMAKNLSSVQMKLTPTEIRVCDLIKQEKTSKEITSLMNISMDAVSAHRYRLRKKLGLLNSKINLKTYLQNLTD